MVLWDLSQTLDLLQARAYRNWDFAGMDISIGAVGSQTSLVDQMVLNPAERQKEQDQGTQTDSDATGGIPEGTQLSDSMGDVKPNESSYWENTHGETQH